MSRRDRPIRHNVGVAGWGDNAIRGLSVRNELAGNDGYWSLLSLTIDGPRLSPETCRFLDEAALCATTTDPRIWPFKIGWLVGAYGNAMAAAAAIETMLPGALLGPLATLPCVEVLCSLADARAAGPNGMADWFAARREAGDRVAGYGVPARQQDERVSMLSRCAQRHNRDGGEHWQILTESAALLEADLSRLRPNLALAIAAIALDLGYVGDQVGFFAFGLAQPSMWANAVASATARPALLRHLPESRVRYRGASPRVSGRAHEKISPQRNFTLAMRAETD